MAVEDKYVDANVAADKLGTPALVKFGDVYASVVTFEVAANDDNGSVYRLLKNLDPELIPLSIEILNDAITSGTDFDLGFYETLSDGQGGAVVDKDELVDAVDLSSARVSGAGFDGLTAVNIANRTKMIYELLGHTISTKKSGYDLCLTGNVVGSAAGTVTIIAFFTRGQ